MGEQTQQQPEEHLEV